MTAIQRILAVPGHISLLIFLAALTAPPGSAQAPTYATIYSFKGPPTDGGAPEASLLIGAQPELFGTTAGGGASNYGTIFELTPAIGDSWNETLLYTFSGPDGAYPNASLVANGADGFYGTTEAGGAGGGTLFQLLPPTSPGGTWTETVLYDFDPSDKSPNRTPNGAVLGPNGTLYTTTFNNAADSFRPPAEPGGVGTESTIYTFQSYNSGLSPSAALLLEGEALYGTDYYSGNLYCNCGVVYELSPPATPGAAWTETTIHFFTGSPDGGGSRAALTAGPGGVPFRNDFLR